MVWECLLSPGDSLLLLCLILNLCLFADAEQEKGEEEHFLVRGDRLLSLLVYPVTA